MCGRWGKKIRSGDQTVGGQKCCMCGDAEACSEGDFDVREMGSAIDALRRIMIMSSYEEVYLCGGVSGELVAVMCDVIPLCELWDVIASCYVKCLLECM